MDWVWNPWALVGLASGVASWTMAAIVFLNRPDRPANRLLALFLALAGSTWFLQTGLAQVLDSPREAYAATLTGNAVHVATHFVHLLFLATLPSPLVAWLRPRLVQWALGVAFAAWIAFIVASPTSWISSMERGVSIMTWDSVPGPAHATLRTWLLFPGLWAFGCIASLTAFANRGAWTDRKQAIAYALAFSVHDGGFALVLPLRLLGGPAIPAVVFPVLNLWLGALLAYGILRTQLFDIDLRVKWTIRRGTLVGAFVAAFFVAAAVAEQYLEQYGVLFGGVAAGLLLFALRPLERAADRFANIAMPQVRDTDEYRTVRKREVYRAAVESALQDGAVTERERDVLATLAQQLGLGPVEARAIEREATAAGGGRA